MFISKIFYKGKKRGEYQWTWAFDGIYSRLRYGMFLIGVHRTRYPGRFWDEEYFNLDIHFFFFHVTFTAQWARMVA